MATIEDKYNNFIKLINLKDYYDKGYKGKGITIASVESTTDSHGRCVKETVLTYAPEATVISFNDTHDYSATGDSGSWLGLPIFADWCIENKVDIITSSLDWTCDKEEEKQAIQKLYDAGIIFFNCAGNAGSERKLNSGTKASSIDEGIVTVSGLSLNATDTKFTWAGYNYGNAVDVVCLGQNVPFKSYFDKNDSDYEYLCEKYGRNFIWNSWSGTSSATPLMAAIFAVLKSANKNVNSKNAMEIIKTYSKLFTYKDRDYNQFNLPELDKFIETKKEATTSKVESTTPVQNNLPTVNSNTGEVSSWAKEARDKLMELGITDGTNPKNQITREEVWTMLYRLYNKI